jgi:hypothetical protein
MLSPPSEPAGHHDHEIDVHRYTRSQAGSKRLHRIRPGYAGPARTPTQQNPPAPARAASTASALSVHGGRDDRFTKQPPRHLRRSTPRCYATRHRATSPTVVIGQYPYELPDSNRDSNVGEQPRTRAQRSGTNTNSNASARRICAIRLLLELERSRACLEANPRTDSRPEPRSIMDHQ